MMPVFINKVLERREAIENWLQGLENNSEIPLYQSTDIRDSGFKVAVVDANLFPAGFNNLCPHSIAAASASLKYAIQNRIKSAGNNILLIMEEHTRNKWYLENIKVLKGIIEKSGFNVIVSTSNINDDELFKGESFVEVDTQLGHKLKLYSASEVLPDGKFNNETIDLIILNNDLISGIPDALAQVKMPVYPSMEAGWHSRLKSNHFGHTKDLIAEFSEIVKLDPWFFSCLDANVYKIDINVEADRERLYNETKELMSQIKEKYLEYNINAEPYVYLKADYGTYGMGVLTD